MCSKSREHLVELHGAFDISRNPGALLLVIAGQVHDGIDVAGIGGRQQPAFGALEVAQLCAFMRHPARRPCVAPMRRPGGACETLRRIAVHMPLLAIE